MQIPEIGDLFIYEGDTLTVEKRTRSRIGDKIFLWNKDLKCPLEDCELIQPNHNYLNNIISVYRGEITVDESKIDPFVVPKFDIPEWKPKGELKPYSELKKLRLDIETLGLDPKKDRVISIGLRTEKGENIIFCKQDEQLMLSQAVTFIENYSPELLTGYNHCFFDLPFIMKRCDLHDVDHRFSFDNRTTRLNNAIVNGRPIEFTQIVHPSINIVDVYHEVIKNDNIRRILTSRTLKQAALQFDLRKEARLELDYREIKRLWAIGDIDPINEYLGYDLEDTELLENRFMPDVYYQKMFLPSWSIQRLATTGNGTKWNTVLKSLYPGYEPEADEKLEFEGGLTKGIVGLHRNVSKVDVASLYPSIMLKYGITSYKDSDNKMLGVLKYLLDERLRLKQLAKSGDKEADQKQGALKVMINSAFGFLGTNGVSFNDYKSAAKVTAIGRSIARLMEKASLDFGCKTVELDTDGLMMSAPIGKNAEAFDAIQAAMPEGIKLDHEFSECAVYIPPDKKGNGLKKNYLIFQPNGTIKASGQFRKRDRSELERTFTIDYLKLYLDHPSKAELFYEDLIEKLKLKEYPVENLSITRKIRVGELALKALGSVGDTVTYWEGINGKTNSDPYKSQIYINMVDEMREKILKYVDPQLLKAKSLQMSLF